eukprot:m51a1_g13337 hypothetical protein (244) ;mRNA; f:628-2147
MSAGIIVILVFATAMPSGAQQPRATTAPYDGRPLEEIANTVAVALELSISQAEQLASELALVAEASPDACSDDPNVSAAVVQGSWRDLFTPLFHHAGNAPCDRGSLEEIANTVAVALELSISQAEQLTSELALVAEASPGACSDDPNVSAAVVQGSWRSLFSRLLLPERAGWTILTADRFGSTINVVVINMANGTLDIGPLQSIAATFSVFTFPWYTAAMERPGALAWDHFFVGGPRDASGYM